ncbi:DUF397 domain-containing protein [Streptomyces sp. 3211]|uniref:DUF397 domain-containing protein n=1 Tax=Streptomyces sp. 3211 TaxID=1964449 RepID=UPI0009A543C8|nr:DUF397 domain-containing protein [Streptomyces sp. 3211]
MTHIPSHQLAPVHAWKKSSYSDGTGNNCIEVANLLATNGAIYVRDSKNIEGPALRLDPKRYKGLLSLAIASVPTP